MLSDLTLAELLERTAAGTPVPGGGSLSAMAAAAGAALAQMVAGLTAGRRQYAAAAAAMNDLAEAAERLRAELLEAMDRDAEAYTGVMAALQMPRGTDDEKARRTDAIQDATREAARVPLAVAEKALEVMALAHQAIRQGNPNAASDGAVGAFMARAALQGAVCNVRINLRSIRDKAFTVRMAKKSADLEARAVELEAAILADINL